jgi:plastocyanin
MTDPRPLSRHSPESSRLTRRRLLAIGAGAAGGVALAHRAFGFDYHNEEDDDDSGRGRGRGRGGDSDEVQPAGTVPAGSAEVRIVDDDANGFQPGTITIDAGQSVTWVNIDDDDHTATGAAFDTGIMRPGDLRTLTFDEPGTYPYSCQYHPMMVGVVEVRGDVGSVVASASPGATPDATPDATPVAATGGEASVTIVNLAFDPANLEVTVGTTVTWTNAEAIPHTVTAAGGEFGSEILNEGDTFSHTFNAAGEFDYICAVHPNMTGTVTVR